MGAMHSIWEDLLEETSFSLYAIHSNLEDYALAYHLNQSCGLRLRRTETDVEVAGETAFPCFQWNDRVNFQEWTLFANKGSGAEIGSSSGLFPKEPAFRRHFLIPEKRTVDFFLKLEGEATHADMVDSLRSVPKVVTAYALEPSGLKSKLNLIL